MVRQLKNLFECEGCNMWYKEEKLANQCERWCKTHQSCNLEIIKLSV